MFVLKVSGSDWKNQSRDKRELSVYEELGHKVAVLAKGSIKDKGRLDFVDGYTVYRYSTRPLGTRAPVIVNRGLSLIVWANFIRKLKPDVISGHDLLPGLTIAWLSTLFSKKKPALIYDSHEFELGRNARRNELTRWLINKWEGFLIKRCAFSIMVNDSIADEVQKNFKLKNRPIVVRSTPEKWQLNETEIGKERNRLEAYFKVKSSSKDNNRSDSDFRHFFVLYHGALTNDRGIESLIDLVSINPNIFGIILGDGTDSYVAQLKQRIETKNIQNRVLFLPAVPIKDLWKIVGAVDLCLITIKGNSKSYYYSLPNKFFESVQSLTPMVASCFPELERIIDNYGIGLTCDPDDIVAINDCVERMRTDFTFYSNCKKNLIKAKDDLCWENEKSYLINAVAMMLENH